jgi:hypothetical protein
MAVAARESKLERMFSGRIYLHARNISSLIMKGLDFAFANNTIMNIKRLNNYGPYSFNKYYELQHYTNDLHVYTISDVCMTEFTDAKPEQGTG